VKRPTDQRSAPVMSRWWWPLLTLFSINLVFGLLIVSPASSAIVHGHKCRGAINQGTPINVYLQFENGSTNPEAGVNLDLTCSQARAVPTRPVFVPETWRKPGILWGKIACGMWVAFASER